MAFYQPPNIPVAPPPVHRFLAYILDLWLVGLAWITLAAITNSFPGLPTWAAGLGLTWMAAYYILSMLRYHTTPGKRLFKMRIVMQDGSPLQPDAAILRFLVFFVTCLIPLGVLASGALMLFDPERRAVHDRLAHTVVVSGYDRF